MVAVLRFVVGCDIERFQEYYQNLDDLHEFYRSHNLDDTTFGQLGEYEKRHIERDPNHLIVWIDDDEIVGHTIWHETSTEEMIEGDARDEEDSEKLRKLFGHRKENLVELHEVWLRTEHRGRGFGGQFFAFFERFAVEKGFEGIVYYTDNPAAVSLCRGRGYREAPEPLEGEGWYVFALPLNKQ